MEVEDLVARRLAGARAYRPGYSLVGEYVYQSKARDIEAAEERATKGWLPKILQDLDDAVQRYGVEQLGRTIRDPSLIYIEFEGIDSALRVGPAQQAPHRFYFRVEVYIEGDVLWAFNDQEARELAETISVPTQRHVANITRILEEAGVVLSRDPELADVDLWEEQG